MWRPSLGRVDPVIRSTAAALLCNFVTQRLSSRQSEVASEALSWILLPIIFRILRRSPTDELLTTILPSKHEYQHPSSVSLWVIVLGIASFSIIRAEIGMLQFLPALTPLLLVTQRYLGSPTTYSERFDDALTFDFTANVCGTIITALFGIATLSDWHPRGYALSTLPAAALLIVYLILMPRTSKTTRFIPQVEIGQYILPLARRIVSVFVVVLFIEAAVYGFPIGDFLVIIPLALAKAVTWYFMSETARLSSWCTASATATFSMISAYDAFSISSTAQPILYIIASLLALGQVICVLPRQVKGASILWIFSLISIAAYPANSFAVTMSQNSLVDSPDHPVAALARQAQMEFQGLLQRQSRNITAANAEYRRRYGMEPPPGFEAWYEFATSHKSPIIDDFDVIYDALRPFWKLSGKEVLNIVRRAHQDPNNDLWLCEYTGSSAKSQCSHPFRSFDRHAQQSFDSLMANLPGALPDITLLVNPLDEPRVIIPPSPLGDGFPPSDEFDLQEMSREPAWDTLTQTCPSPGGRGDGSSSDTVETFGLPFVTNTSSAMDLCQHPEYQQMHGLAISPSSFRLIEGRVPLLSTGAPSTMADILYPSPAYMEPEFQYVDEQDIDWNKKRNNLYWAGSTTGGFAWDSQWPYFHRQRFIEFAQNLGRRPHSYLRAGANMISRVSSSLFNRRLFDVAFTRILQCERPYCRAQHMAFNIKPWAGKDQALQSRLVFDLDGNGISGRYYKLLASKSVPLKQTLFREWHDERLIPWVHYIPVSQSMEELPEMVSYLTSTVTGQTNAREIAEQGRVWFSEAFREVDLAIYIYRLLLELARLQDPERQAGSVNTKVTKAGST